MQVVGDKSAKAMTSSLTINGQAGGVQMRVAAARQMAVASASTATTEWSEDSTVALPSGFNHSGHALVAGRISGSQQEDLIVVDSANSQVHVLSTRGSQKQSNLLVANAAKAGPVSTSVPQMNLLTSMDATSTPVAVLPMRLSQHGLSGLVSLQSNVDGPVAMPAVIAPTNVFTVTNRLDITDPSQKNSPPDGSLRAAMENAQNASASNGGGTYSIVFNIPTSDPGYNSATGIYKIQPMSENVPNSLDNFALPPINATLTIDGYTQPGASPNTSATADNAKIVIQIDGATQRPRAVPGLYPSTTPAR